jgi:hypothetical protein
MGEFNRAFKRNIPGLVLFVAGIVISASLSGFLEKMFTLYESVLVLMTVVLVVAVLYLIGEHNRRLEEMANRQSTTVYYIDEPWRVNEGITFQGHIFNELKRLVSNAEFEVLVVTAVSKEWRAQQTDAHPSRMSYIRALEKVIERHQERGFTYIRILQMPTPIDTNIPFADYVGSETTAHCRRVLELEHTANSPKFTVSIMRGPTHRLTGFMLIDRRFITVMIDGITLDGHSYQSGLFVIEDIPNGKLVQEFYRQFTGLERDAANLKLADIPTPT